MNDYPRLAKPRLGLSSYRCSAARRRFTAKSSGCLGRVRQPGSVKYV